MPSLGLLLKKDFIQFKNYFVDMRNHPKRILIFFFYFLYAGFMVWINGINASDSQGEMSYTMVNSFAFGLLFMMLIMNVGTTKKELFSLFKPADLNITFTSPISPRTIFAASLIKSMYSNVLLIAFMMLFLSGKMIASGAGVLDMLSGALGILVLFLLLQPMTFISVRLKGKVPVMLSQSLMMSVVVLPAIYVFYRSGFNIIQMMNSDLLNWVPFAGWSKALILLCYNYRVAGIELIALMYAVSVLLIVGFCLYLADDYYEDVYDGTVNMTRLRKRQREGNKLQFSFKWFESRRSVVMSSETGHSAYYWKEKVIKNKSDLHHLFGFYELAVILAAVGVVIYNMITGGEHYWFAYVLNGVYAYLLLIVAAANKSEEDFLTARFIMIPEKNSLKLFSMHRLAITRLVLNVLIFNGILMFTKGVEPLVLGVMVGLQLVFYIILLYSNILSKVFFQNPTDAAVMMPFIKMVQMLLVALPTGVAAGVVGAMTESVFWTVLAVFGINLLIASVFIACTGSLARRIELSK
ncbi:MULTISPECIES: putative ABC exporter domain-containing protein [unclassified Fusibacter]|uniref:putative ABC exporter domain-containing protein n=1 Tax=unclassified Fusibacter TaxID=2624464 RepID=UPI0010104F51|nr:MULTISPECIES: putative ABC exporter domain-containing protein [unclassified Fusibacter]MCK8061639.1 putative ABC exporter domain-containing protein [Fusibacter sp. A2]NPE23823.1 hypothetical protein [Fusibacter sp. A1]RXV58596.1 hypothetical protein DWB64_18730 [Fusibacter sp. A1]